MRTARWFAGLALALLQLGPFLPAAAAQSGSTPSPALDDRPPAAGSAMPETAAPASTEEPVSIDEIRRFVSVFRAVKQAYVDPVDDATLMRAAIRGLLTDLDPHSAYLDKTASQDLNEMTSGAYDGLGVEVVQQPDRSLLVIAPIDDTPAARAGVRAGDLIVGIDGKPVQADNVEGAIDSMRGEAGTPIRLTIVRDGEPAPFDLTLVRETIKVASVRARTLEPGYGYLRISHFQADTGRDVARKLARLKKAGPIRGLVLDLRSNPGGLLHPAVEVADQFLEDGVVVSTRGRLPFSVSEMRATAGDALAGAPIVALIDGGTASAAEVLAAALHDQHRALLLGSTSFGKGSVQTVLPLDNGDSIKLTTARYYTPSGGSIQASGIVPDIALPDGAELTLADGQPPTVRERDLPGHLAPEHETPEAAPVTPPPAVDSTPDQDDFAVDQALMLLKGLALFGAPTLPGAQPSAKGDGP